MNFHDFGTNDRRDDFVIDPRKFLEQLRSSDESEFKTLMNDWNEKRTSTGYSKESALKEIRLFAEEFVKIWMTEAGIDNEHSQGAHTLRASSHYMTGKNFCNWIVDIYGKHGVTPFDASMVIAQEESHAIEALNKSRFDDRGASGGLRPLLKEIIISEDYSDPFKPCMWIAAKAQGHSVKGMDDGDPLLMGWHHQLLSEMCNDRFENEMGPYRREIFQMPAGKPVDLGARNNAEHHRKIAIDLFKKAELDAITLRTEVAALKQQVAAAQSQGFQPSLSMTGVTTIYAQPPGENRVPEQNHSNTMPLSEILETYDRVKITKGTRNPLKGFKKTVPGDVEKAIDLYKTEHPEDKDLPEKQLGSGGGEMYLTSFVRQPGYLLGIAEHPVSNERCILVLSSDDFVNNRVTWKNKKHSGNTLNVKTTITINSREQSLTSHPNTPKHGR